MKRILFVDDEPNILMGLRRSLRTYRDQWEMFFAQGSEAALEHCARSSFDVIVSDVRMPGMDGPGLMREMLRHHPDTVRIILSGQCSDISVFRCLGVAHQFLSKPCPPDILRGTIDRICAVREVYDDESLRVAMSSVQRLPSRAATCRQLVDRSSAPTVTVDEIADIITDDVALSAWVVYLVSSGFFGSPQRVASGAQAVRLLGIERLKSFMGECTGTQMRSWKGGEQALEAINAHSRAVARAARHIVALRTDDLVVAGDAELAGMLHRVGSLALGGSGVHDTRTRPVTSAIDPGGYLVALWGLSPTVVQAVSYYRAPQLCAVQDFSPLTAVHVAAACYDELHGPVGGERLQPDLEYLSGIACADDLEQWRQICHMHFAEGALV